MNTPITPRTAPPPNLPVYALADHGRIEKRADGSTWVSHVRDCGRHFSVIWTLAILPDGTVLKR